MATAIKYGMKGDDVKNLQTTLNNLGYSLDVDGNFGPQTLAAVKNYQQANGLDVDGMVGPQTQAALSKTGSTSGKTNTSAKTSTAATGSGSAASAATKVNYPDKFTYDDFSYGDFSYGDFNYGGYQESETVQQAGAALQAALAAQPGAYQSKWQSQVDSIIDQILNRQAFNYDFNEDALYKQYAEQYTRRGKLAMQDTMGQAAAMTGGYGSSYASTAGNQAYQEYLSQLNEVIPELYGMALDRYQMEGQEMYNQYSMLSAQEQQEYARYMDDYNKWLSERDYATGRYDSERDYDYSKYIDDRNYEYGKYIDDRNYEYGKYVDDRNYAYGVYSDDKNYAYNDYLNEINKAQFDAQHAEDIRQYNETMDYNKATDAQKAAENRVYTAIENGVMPSEADIKASGLDSKYVQELYNSYDDKKTESASEKTKAEAMDKIGTYIAAGMEVPKKLQKQAGLSDDDLAALVGASTKSSSSSTTSKSMSSTDIDEWSSAVLDAETEEDATAYLTELEKINPDLADYLWEKWLKTHGYDSSTTDTTVNTKPTYSGGGGGKILQAVR